MEAAAGPVNMAIDEALATLCRDRATLRFYAWQSPTISIGYAQRSRDIDLSACRASMVSVVRRPTGGRAVLHHRELTYSLTLPMCPPWTTISIAESYRRINLCLSRGLERLGLHARVGDHPSRAGGALSSFCFAALSRHEVLVDDKKIIGSAQRRFPTALLQQGSILLDFEPIGILDLFPAAERVAAASALRTVGSLREGLGRLPDRSEVERAIRDGLNQEMGIEFVEGGLLPEESQQSVALAETRYGSDEWTFRC